MHEWGFDVAHGLTGSDLPDSQLIHSHHYLFCNTNQHIELTISWVHEWSVCGCGTLKDHSTKIIWGHKFTRSMLWSLNEP